MDTPEKLRERNQRYYAENRETILNRQKAKYKFLSETFHAWRDTLECSMCGFDDGACLDFHHCDPTQKETSIIRQATKSKEKMIEELNKCVVVCANCHRKAHAYNIETDPL